MIIIDNVYVVRYIPVLPTKKIVIDLQTLIL